MAFNFLQSRVEKTIKKIHSKGVISKENIESFIKELRIILLESDVNLKVANEFIEDLNKEAIGAIVGSDRTTSQKILEITNNKLINLLGGKTQEWNYKSKSIVMLVGLQGSGKTTTAAKLTNFLVSKQKKYKKPLLVGLDVYRPAAIDQLETLSKKIFADFFSIRNEKNVDKILKEAFKFAEKNENDLIILDTAGRLQTDEKLMTELVNIKKIAKPSEIIFVVDSLSGQEILNVAKEFNNKLNLSSFIITKLDSESKGGASLSICYALKLSISFIGVGEKISNLEVFHPDRMASRILGLGDIKTLTEKVAEFSDENDQERMLRKMMSGTFDLEDLLISMSQMSKIGSLGSVSKMMPGMNISDKMSDVADKKMKHFTVLINSMTGKEKKNPKLLKHPKRKNRILIGSGRNVQELNELLRQFEKSQKQMKEIGKIIKSGKVPNFNQMAGRR